MNRWAQLTNSGWVGSGRTGWQPTPHGKGPEPGLLPREVAWLCHTQPVLCGFCFSSETGLSVLDKDKHTLETHLLIIRRGKKETHKILSCILQMARKMSVKMNNYFWLRGQNTFLWAYPGGSLCSQAAIAWPDRAGPLCSLPHFLRKTWSHTSEHYQHWPLSRWQMLSRPLLLALAGW